MDITNICKVILCIEILKRYSLYQVNADDGILFKVSEMVEWSQAEQSCQKYNGTLFKPNKTSFDVPLFSECNFNDDLWVAATYINILSLELASMHPDPVIRCEICTIGERCETTCLYKACGNRCRAVCKYHFEPHKLVLSDRPDNWTEAKRWCSEQMSEFGDKIQNASSLFSNRYCDTGCIWTRHVINVQLQPNIAPVNEEGECGILHDGTLSFTSCNIHLHPLCERVAKTALETPRLSFSEGNNSCILMNNTITYTKASEAFRPNRINVTIITSSTNGKSTVANEISKRTTFGLNEDNSSLLAPVGVTTSRNDHESAPHKSDTGIIIGAVIGSFVFLMMIFLGIICIRRGLLQRLKENKSKHVARNTKMRNTDTYDPNQCHDVPLETRSGLTVFAQLESNCEGSKTGILGTISDPRKPASVFDLDGSKFNYETLNRNVYVNSINQNSATNYDDYEHLNRVHEDRDINSQGNMYDSVRFE